MARRGATYRFRLYVVSGTNNSNQALVNLSELCEAHLPQRHVIEVVDVFRDPERALADGIFMTPTLVKLGPGLVKKIVGTLNHRPILLQALGLQRADALAP